MTDSPSLNARIYNGVDERVGWPIVITKPIVPVGVIPVFPVGRIRPRPPKTTKVASTPPPKKPKKSWLRRLLGM